MAQRVLSSTFPDFQSFVFWSRLLIHPSGVEEVLDLGEHEHITSCLISTSGNSANTDSFRQAKVIPTLATNKQTTIFAKRLGSVFELQSHLECHMKA